VINQREAHFGIQRLLTLYCFLIDDLRMQEWGELFCRDATWTFGSHHFVGRDSIVAGVGAMEPKKAGAVRHLTLAPILDFEGQDVYSWADAIALTVGAQSSQIVAAGRYHDVVREVDGRWRFFRRIFIPSGEPVPSGIRPPPAI
jgi:hypothetical protein